MIKNELVFYLVHELDIKRKVEVNFAPEEGNFAKGQNGATFFDTEDKVIRVFINSESDSMIRALCHEMVHAKQIDEGRLFLGKIRGETVMTWEGKMVPPRYQRSAPWEVEAHIQEKILFNKLRKHFTKKYS